MNSQTRANPLPFRRGEPAGTRPPRSRSIALICHSYPPVIGGSEIEAQRICAGLLARGHRVEVLCCGGPPMPAVSEWVDPEGIPVRIFSSGLNEPWRSYNYALGIAWRLLRRRRHYDVVYFLMSGLHLTTGLPAARLIGKPILMKFSGSNLIRSLARTWLGRLEIGFLQKWSQRIMVLNDGMVEEAIEAGLDPGKLMWMPNPVDTDIFAPVSSVQRSELRQHLGLAPDRLSVLYVGRLAPEKELASLVKSFESVAVEFPQSELVLVGDGPCRSELENLVNACGLRDRVRFTGMVPSSDVRLWTQSCDVFTLVSSLEGLPCSLIEAMSVGLAAVVSDIPANVQLIEHGTHGLVASLKDEPGIARCLGAVLGDPSLRLRLGTAARDRIIETYSLAKVIEVYEALIEETLSGTTSAAR
jgi:glycosyltransferase involved in cell wall biosynthesis